MVRRIIPSSAVEDFWSAHDGHAIRRINWGKPDSADKSRGSLLFLPGRGEAYEKYLESFEDWRQRGWHVSASDWRGQAGSGRLGADAYTGHIDDFSCWTEDLGHFWRQWSAERKGKRVLVGHSMGGHLVLKALADGLLSPAPDALVLCAPMLGVHPNYVPIPIQRLFAGAMNMVGDPRRLAWKWSEKPGEVPPGRQALLTHCDDRYADEMWWREKRAELVMGPGSWGWVASALRSIAALNRRGMVEKIETPTFILGTSDDRLVCPRAIDDYVERLPRAESLIMGSEARHEILREVDDVRSRALAGIDDFLDRHIAL